MEQSPPLESDLVELVEGTLRAYGSHAPHRWDAGPAILAALACELGMATNEVIDLALARWMETLQVSAHLGLFGGLSGVLVGAHAVSPHRPRFVGITDRLQRVLEHRVASGPWRTEGLGWHDYDLVSGAAGVVLAATMVAPDGHGGLPALAAAQLVSLCEGDDLGRMRIASYRDEELLAWNYGRINTGLAHGVGGVVAGLCRAQGAAPTQERAAALRRACRWLAEESYVDPRGLQTWCPAALEGAAAPVGVSRRQAWCYGTPGLAWVLWESGQVLDDRELMERAESAMRSYCAVFDEDVYLGHDPPEQALAVCHGAAGILAIADAFAIHAGLPEAAALAESLTRSVRRRLDQVPAIATRDMTLLSGASGILAVLLTRAGGSRTWLQSLALR